MICEMAQPGGTRLLVLAVVNLAYLACTTSAAAPSQAGFVSIDCGTTVAYTDRVTGINWVPDTNYTSDGTNVVNVPGSSKWSNNSELATLRAFTDRTRTKHCYVFPGTTPNASYMIRHGYYYGAYDGAQGTNPVFQVFIDASLAIEVDPSQTIDIIFYYQHTYKALSDTISFCLIRSYPGSADPFISSLELRPLLPGAYEYDFLRDTGLLLSVHWNYGGDRIIRYPDDEYDRIWKPVSVVQLTNITSDVPIGNVNKLPLRIPSAVMQTGQTPPTIQPVTISFPRAGVPRIPATLELHFAELNGSSSARTFTIEVAGNPPLSENAAIETGGPHLAHTVTFENWTFAIASDVLLTPASGATDAPLLNALSVHLKLSTKKAVTYGPDVKGLEQFKAALNLTSWYGDPCLPVPYNWVQCSTVQSPPRILSVNLSGYNLVGEIPAAITTLTALTALALDNNALTGTIPNLSPLQSLVLLHVHDNQLGGSIPATLALIPTLKELYLQNNNFTGTVPDTLIRQGLAIDVRGNPGLTSTTLDTSPVPPPPSASRIMLTVGLIAGAAGGSLAVVLVFGCILVFFIRKGRNKDTKPSVFNGTSSEGNQRQQLSATLAYSLHDVKVAANNYSRKIGQGGFGSVYYGRLANGFEVAIKVCDPSALPDAEEFNIEVDVLSRVHHRNLVELVGYCTEKKSQILIYEFLHEGTVQEHLYESEKAIKYPLDWKARLCIALDAAQGLEYLHVGCTPYMIHRDIKSCNILLTDKYMAKIADFGLCKLAPCDGETHVSTVGKGTFGYLDPEYFETQTLTAKSDVYSFGVFLLELIAARKPIDNFVSDEERCHITTWARGLMNNGDVETLAGACITLSNDPDMNSVWKVAELAMRCVERKPKFRPVMSEVVEELRAAVAMEGAHSGFDSSSSINLEPSQARARNAPHWGRV